MADTPEVSMAKKEFWRNPPMPRAKCPKCGMPAVCELPPILKLIQGDGTTMVCHPQWGGCNWGFTIDNEKKGDTDE